MEASPQPALLLVDDNAFNREGLALFLRRRGFNVIEAGDATTSLELAQSVPPAVVIIDVVIPVTPDSPFHMNESVGIDLALELKQLNPAMPLVLFTAHEDRGDLFLRLVGNGWRGLAYLLKGRPPAKLMQAIEAAMAGEVFMDPAVVTNRQMKAEEMVARLTPVERPWVEQAVAGLNQLTPQERKVAQRLAASHNPHGIAQVLDLAPKTVQNTIGRIYEKLGLTEMTDQAPGLRKSVVLAKACMLEELQRER